MHINTDKMKESLNRATIIDVRTPEEFAIQHFPNAINIPLDQMQQKIEQLKQTQKQIIASCRSGNRSGKEI